LSLFQQRIKELGVRCISKAIAVGNGRKGQDFAMSRSMFKCSNCNRCIDRDGFDRVGNRIGQLHLRAENDLPRAAPVSSTGRSSARELPPASRTLALDSLW